MFHRILIEDWQRVLSTLSVMLFLTVFVINFIRVARMPMAKVARALEVGETRGFMKAIVDAGSDRILGAAVLGLEGGEVMSMLELAMMGKQPYPVLRDAVFAHPTLAEALNNLFTHFDSKDV